MDKRSWSQASHTREQIRRLPTQASKLIVLFGRRGARRTRDLFGCRWSAPAYQLAQTEELTLSTNVAA